MNPFYDDIAARALAHYPQLKDASLRFFAEESNINYLVEKDGVSYFMKLFVDHSSTMDDNIAEAVLLEHLSTTTDLNVPRVLRNADDAFVTEVPLADGSVKRAMIATFLTGEPLHERETKERIQALGRMLATLHRAAASLTIPSGVSFKRWDRVLYWRDEVPHYHKPEYRDRMSDADRDLLDRVFPYLDQRLQNIYYGPTILVHGDANPWNVLVEGDDVKLIDFEDALIATPVHDLAICLFYYRYDEHYDYEVMREWLIDGYRDVDPDFLIDWDIVEMLIIARMVNFINHVLILWDDPKSFIVERMRRLRQYLNQNSITLD